MNENVWLGITQNPNDYGWVQVFMEMSGEFSFKDCDVEYIPCYKLLNPAILSHTHFCTEELDTVKKYFATPSATARFLELAVVFSVSYCIDALDEFILDDEVSGDNLNNALESAMLTVTKLMQTRAKEVVLCKSF